MKNKNDDDKKCGLNFLNIIFQPNYTVNRKLGENDAHIARELLEVIGEKYRKYLLFREVLKLSYSEIAEHLEVDEETARRNVQEANVHLAMISRRYVLAALAIPYDKEHFLRLSRQVYEQALELVNGNNPLDEQAGSSECPEC